MQKIHNVLPICQDITYYLSWSEGKRKEGVLQGNNIFKFQITLDRHNPILILNLLSPSPTP